MQIFGIPFVGSDVCGFGKSTTPELCSRWIQLGSMHPFFRNHNILEGDDQEFFNLGTATLLTARRNVKFRYSLLKFFHSMFLRAKGIGAIIYSPFYIYPTDPKCYLS